MWVCPILVAKDKRLEKPKMKEMKPPKRKKLEDGWARHQGRRNSALGQLCLERIDTATTGQRTAQI